MYCYDQNGILLGFVNCVPNVGENHMWNDDLYKCVGINGKRGCEHGMVFKNIEPNEFA